MRPGWSPHPPPAGSAARLPPRAAVSTGAFLRSLVFATAMFVVAALAGMLLSGAAPANRADPPAPAAESAREAPPDRQSGTALGDDTTAFGRSMVVSGVAALAVSAAGLVIVGRRRRLW